MALAAAQAPDPLVHAASDDEVAAISEEDARRTIAQLSARRGFEGLAVFGPVLEAFTRPSWVQAVEVAPAGFTVRHEKGDIAVALASMPRFTVVTDTVLGISQYGVRVSDADVLWVIDGGLNSERRKANAIRLANAFQALRRAGAVAAVAETDFERLAAQYRAASPKPALPEEVRRARVQAEFAVDHRRFADAAKFYGEGLQAAPWWAAGYFNRALVLAEAGRHAEAIRDMRRYLSLEPQAADSRTAQDMIYRWESIAPTARQAAPAAAPPSSLGGSLLFGPARRE